jgi:arylsulfatase
LRLWRDAPQERYDIFMNNFNEHTGTLVTINKAIPDPMKTYIKYPPGKIQSENYTGPITILRYEKFQWVRDQLKK